MALYTVTRTSAALSTSNDSLTITAHATKALRVLIVHAGGMGTSSAANEIAIMRSTVGTTPGGAITPAPIDPGAPAAGFTVATTWAVQPTPGVVLWRLNVNANGDKDKFIALPGAELQVAAAGQLSIRSASGTSSVSLAVLVEEV